MGNATVKASVVTASAITLRNTTMAFGVLICVKAKDS